MNSKPTRRRNRLTLSCNFCKKRKVKCDRLKPCSSCVKYNVGELCDFNYLQVYDGTMRVNSKNGYTFSPMSHTKDHREEESTSSKRDSISGQKSINIAEDTLRSDFNVMSNRNNLAAAPDYSANIDSNTSKSFSAPAPVQSPLEADQVSRRETPFLALDKIPMSATLRSLSHNDDELNTALEIVKLKEKILRLETVFGEQKDISVNTTQDTATTGPTVSNNSSVFPGFTPRSSSNYEIRDTQPPSCASRDTERRTIQLPPISADLSSRTVKSKRDSREVYKYSSGFNPQFVGINPYDSVEDRINFYEWYEPMSFESNSKGKNYGPLTWFSVMRRDPASKSFCEYIFQVLNTKPCKQIGRSEKVDETVNNSANRESTNRSEMRFRIRSLENGDSPELKLYADMKDSKVEGSSCPSNLSEIHTSRNAIALGLSNFKTKADQELHLIGALRLFLPNQRIIWLSVDMFFNLLYPYLPYLDEDEFRAEVSRIVGPEGYEEEPIGKINVEKRLDFAFIGILFVILRLSYNMLISNRQAVNDMRTNPINPSQKEKDVDYLLQHPVDANIANMARLCLEQFDLHKPTSLPVFQLAVFMMYFRYYSFDEGDSDWQISTAVLSQLAFSIGLNRDPTKFGERSESEKHRNLLRKIWMAVKEFDVAQSITQGVPMIIASKYTDTCLPRFVVDDKKSHSTDIERRMSDWYTFCNDCYMKIEELLGLVLDIHSRFEIKKLTELMNEFELFLSSSCGNLNVLTKPLSQDEFQISKLLKCDRYMFMKMFLFTLYQYIYSYYETKQDYELSSFYIKKLVSIVAKEFVPCLGQIISRSGEIFGEMSDSMINPMAQASLSRSIQIIFIVLVKVNITIYRMKSDELHPQKKLYDIAYKVQYHELCKLSKSLELLAEYSISTLSKLNNRYYYAWRVSKGQNYVQRIIKSEKTYNSIDTSERAGLFYLTTDYLKELNAICEESLADVRRSCKQFKESGNRLQSTESELSSESGFTVTTNVPEVASSKSRSDDDIHEFPFLNDQQTDKQWMSMISRMNVEGVESSLGKYNHYASNTQDSANSLDDDMDFSTFMRNSTYGDFDIQSFDFFSTIPIDQLTSMESANTSMYL